MSRLWTCTCLFGYPQTNKTHRRIGHKNLYTRRGGCHVSETTECANQCGTTECAPGASKRPPLREPPDRLRMSGLGLFRPCRFRTVLNYVVLRFNVILSCHISNHHSTHQRPGSRHRRDLLIIWRHSLCSSLPLAFTRPTIVSARDIGRPPAFIASAPALLIQCCQSHPCDLREVLDKAHCRLL